MSNEDLILSTKKRFAGWLTELTHKYNPNGKEKCLENITTLERISSADWILYVIENIVPYKKDLKALTVKMLTETGLKYETLSMDEHLRFEKFMKFYIDMAA